MMKTRLLWGLALGAAGLLGSGCGDDDRPCTTCPETNPAIVASLDYIDSHKAELGLRDDVDEMIPYRVQQDQLGMTHVRCYQYYKGVRVEGGQLIAHLSAALEVIRVTDGIIRDVQVDVIPAISSWAAARTAREDFQNEGHLTQQEGRFEKVVFRWLDTDHLCWMMTFRAVDALDAREYYVDAHSGAIVHWRSLIISAEMNGL